MVGCCCDQANSRSCLTPWVCTCPGRADSSSGVAKDQKKGFNELRRACDDALANGALDDGALDPKQRRDLNVSETRCIG